MSRARIPIDVILILAGGCVGARVSDAVGRSRLGQSSTIVRMTGPFEANNLLKFDVHPLSLSAAVHYTDHGFEIQLIIVTSSNKNGYSALPLTSHLAPYSADYFLKEEPARAIELQEVLAAATEVFAVRFRRMLNDQ